MAILPSGKTFSWGCAGSILASCTVLLVAWSLYAIEAERSTRLGVPRTAGGLITRDLEWLWRTPAEAAPWIEQERLDANHPTK
jgi:hypothetical protein